MRCDDELHMICTPAAVTSLLALLRAPYRPVVQAAFLAALESFATHLDEEDGCREVRGQGLW